jgi:Spy/CpxP family protein refolding chaperone
VKRNFGSLGGVGRLGCSVLTLTLTLASGSRAVQAQPRPAPPTPAPTPSADNRSPEQLRKEVLERMRALRAWKIVEALKLDEATSARLFPILSRYDEREMENAAERHEIMRDLRAATEAPHPDDAHLTATLNKLLANRAKERALHDDRVKDVRKVLTPVQQAKLVLLLPRLERDFAGWIHEASGRPGPGPGDDP